MLRALYVPPREQLADAPDNTTVNASRPEMDFGDYRGAEWAGATFSPDGATLFVNIQTPGITFAITGPWDGLAAGTLRAA